MAEIVQSLFGVTPESYQRAQQARMDEQALQFARLDPFQQANYAIGRGASGLAGAIGGALGGQDPELQRITLRQQIAGQLDYNDDASMKEGIVALNNAGDSAGAMQLQQILLSQQAKRASISKDEAAAQASRATALRERGPTGKVAEGARAREIFRALQAPDLSDIERNALEAELTIYTPAKTKDATTNEITNAAAFAAGQGFKPGTPEYTNAFQSKFTELITKAPAAAPSVGTDREAIAQAAPFNKPYAQLTPDEKAKVNALADQKALDRAKATAPKFALPGQDTLVDIPAFRAKVQATIQPQSKAINAADQALQAIEDSLATGNFASYRAAQVQFARAIAGAGDLSQRELKAAGADPSLLGGTADYLSSLFTSTPTADTQNKIKVTLEAIRKVAAKKASAEVEQQRKIALRSPGYNVEAVTEALTFPELAPRVAAPAPGAPGGDLAAQAAAILEQRAAGKAKK